MQPRRSPASPASSSSSSSSARRRTSPSFTHTPVAHTTAIWQRSLHSPLPVPSPSAPVPSPHPARRRPRSATPTRPRARRAARPASPRRAQDSDVQGSKLVLAGRGLSSKAATRLVRAHGERKEGAWLSGVDLSRNEIVTVRAWPGMLALTVLDLSHNRIEELAFLPPGLRSLNLAHNRLVRLDATEVEDGLASLVELDVSGNALTSTRGLAQCESLVSLNVSGNRLSLLEGLDALGQLQRLDVSDNFIERMENLRPLSLNTALSQLSVRGNPLARRPNAELAIFQICPSLRLVDEATRSSSVSWTRKMTLEGGKPKLAKVPSKADIARLRDELSYLDGHIEQVQGQLRRSDSGVSNGPTAEEIEVRRKRARAVRAKLKQLARENSQLKSTLSLSQRLHASWGGFIALFADDSASLDERHVVQRLHSLVEAQLSDLPGYAAGVFLVDDASSSLRRVDTMQTYALGPTAAVSGIASQVAHTATPIESPVAREHALFNAEVDLAASDTASLVCAPLVYRSVLGVVQVAFEPSDGVSCASVLVKLQSLLAHAAPALAAFRRMSRANEATEAAWHSLKRLEGQLQLFQDVVPEEALGELAELREQAASTAVQLDTQAERLQAVTQEKRRLEERNEAIALDVAQLSQRLHASRIVAVLASHYRRERGKALQRWRSFVRREQEQEAALSRVLMLLRRQQREVKLRVLSRWRLRTMYVQHVSDVADKEALLQEAVAAHTQRDELAVKLKSVVSQSRHRVTALSKQVVDLQTQLQRQTQALRSMDESNDQLAVQVAQSAPERRRAAARLVASVVRKSDSRRLVLRLALAAWQRQAAVEPQFDVDSELARARQAHQQLVERKPGSTLSVEDLEGDGFGFTHSRRDSFFASSDALFMNAADESSVLSSTDSSEAQLSDDERHGSMYSIVLSQADKGLHRSPSHQSRTTEEGVKMSRSLSRMSSDGWMTSFLNELTDEDDASIVAHPSSTPRPPALDEVPTDVVPMSPMPSGSEEEQPKLGRRETATASEVAAAATAAAATAARISASLSRKSLRVIASRRQRRGPAPETPVANATAATVDTYMNEYDWDAALGLEDGGAAGATEDEEVETGLSASEARKCETVFGSFCFSDALSGRQMIRADELCIALRMVAIEAQQGRVSKLDNEQLLARASPASSAWLSQEHLTQAQFVKLSEEIVFSE